MTVFKLASANITIKIFKQRPGLLKNRFLLTYFLKKRLEKFVTTVNF